MTMRRVEDRRGLPHWWTLYDEANGLGIDLGVNATPSGYDGPASWDVELRGHLDPEERRPIIERWWDALAAGTDWHLVWWSDDDPRNSIIRERLSVNGPNSPAPSMSRFTDNLSLVAHEDYVPNSVQNLLAWLHLEQAPRDQREAAIRDWLEAHPPGRLMVFTLRRNGFGHLLDSDEEVVDG
jgi:hypothetical protein